MNYRIIISVSKYKISKLTFKTVLFCLLSSVFCLLSFHASARFEFTPNCQKAMQAILDLRTVTARELLKEEERVNPDNGYIFYLLHYSDVVELIVTDDEALYERLMDSYEDRFARMDRLDDGSPYNSLLQAEMLLYVGLAQLKYGSQLSGTAKIYSSYLSVKTHLETYPDFGLNLKMGGAYNTMMDFIPQSMRWVAGILGFRGNAEQGMRQLKEYHSLAKTVPGLAEESVIMLTLAYKLSWKEEDGLEFMESVVPGLSSSVLATYLHALMASFSYKNDLALQKLASIDLHGIEVPFYAMDYLAGRCRLNRLRDDASAPLEKFLREYPGLDYKKDVSNRLSYACLLQGDLGRYNEYREMTGVIGQTLRDRDIEALMESQSVIVPHSGLLKARFLFDGGYFTKADSVMNDIPPSSLSLLPYELEFSYRQGRIDQMLGHTEQASLELKKAFEDGAGKPYTFATRAALQLGFLFEQKNDYPNALYWYKKCLETYDETHTVGGVKDKAEKGKKRMEKLM